MSAETVSFEGLAAEVERNSSLSDEERCEALNAIARLALQPHQIEGCAPADGAKAPPEG